MSVICPICGQTRHTKSSLGYYCWTCDQFYSGEATDYTPKPSKPQRTKRGAVTAPKQSEADLQFLIVGWLEAKGYTVMETGKARSLVVCPNCKTKHYPKGWQGNTPGLPDLYVTRRGWAGLWVAMELKTETGAVRAEQKALADSGHSHIVRSLQEAMQVVESVKGEES